VCKEVTVASIQMSVGTGGCKEGEAKMNKPTNLILLLLMGLDTNLILLLLLMWSDVCSRKHKLTQE
jgi:hypothetical protein